MNKSHLDITKNTKRFFVFYFILRIFMNDLIVECPLFPTNRSGLTTKAIPIT